MYLNRSRTTLTLVIILITRILIVSDTGLHFLAGINGKAQASADRCLSGNIKCGQHTADVLSLLIDRHRSAAGEASASIGRCSSGNNSIALTFYRC